MIGTVIRKKCMDKTEILRKARIPAVRRVLKLLERELLNELSLLRQEIREFRAEMRGWFDKVDRGFDQFETNWSSGIGDERSGAHGRGAHATERTRARRPCYAASTDPGEVE